MSFRCLCFGLMAILAVSCNEDTGKEADAGNENNVTTQPADGNATDAPVDLASLLIGSWETEAMTGYINGHNGGTENDTVVTNKDNFQEIFGINGLVAHYYEDGTSLMEGHDSNGVSLFTFEGTWRLSGDTLIETQGNPPSTSKNVISFPDEETTLFSGYMDWDADGEVDDYIEGSSKRVPSE